MPEPTVKDKGRTDADRRVDEAVDVALGNAADASAGKRAALELAEAARDHYHAHDSFAGSLFLGSVPWPLIQPWPGVSAAEEAGALLGDRASMQSSTAHVDALLGQARNVATALSEQRNTFSGISSKLGQMTSAFPAIHNVVNQIRRKKSRDTIVLSAVVCVCTLFVVGYWLAK